MCTWQRITAGLVVLLMASTCIQAEGRLSIAADDAPVDGPATVRLTLEGASETGALDVDISFPPDALQFVSAEVGTSAANGQLQVNAASPGRLKLALIDMDGLNGDGDLAVLTFKVLAPEGQTVSIDIPSATAHHYEAMVEIPLALKGGQLRIVASPDRLSALSPAMLKLLIGIGGVIVAILIIVVVMRARKKS
ncbi:MAG: hypothetical protein KGY99_10910 [Phycisphaerae bacterium]|nr:hypothetical protein [Phycisphaerae bacterium]